MFDPLKAVQDSITLDAAYLSRGVSAAIGELAAEAMEEAADARNNGDTTPPSDAAMVSGETG